MMNALILMTRIPIPGKTKTRLSSFITNENCAKLHTCFLLDLFNLFEKIKDKVDIFLTYTPSDKFYLLENITPSYINSFEQVGDNLGLKMRNSIYKVLESGYDKVVLIGSDVPHLSELDLILAFDKLESSDICLGPTFDGGYYLIGMKKIYDKIFDNDIRWGNKSVFEGTIDLCNNLNIKVSLTTKHLDIDTKDDLLVFKSKLDNNEIINIPKNTANFIYRYWSEFKNDNKYVIG